MSPTTDADSTCDAGTGDGRAAVEYPADVASAVAAFRRGEPVLVHDAADREGETDLLYPAAEVTPAAVAGCEMLDDETGGARSPTDARAYAERHDLPYVEGCRLVEHL